MPYSHLRRIIKQQLATPSILLPLLLRYEAMQWCAGAHVCHQAGRARQHLSTGAKRDHHRQSAHGWSLHELLLHIHILGQPAQWRMLQHHMHASCIAARSLKQIACRRYTLFTLLAGLTSHMLACTLAHLQWHQLLGLTVSTQTSVPCNYFCWRQSRELSAPCYAQG